MSSSNINITTSPGDVVLDKNLWVGYIAIHDCVELQAMQNDLSASYYLANDIDCTYCTQDPDGACYNGGAGFAPIGTFTGTFDGNKHTITGLKMHRGGTGTGLFGAVGNATIKNVGLVDVIRSTPSSDANYIGTLIGHTASSGLSVTNCYSTGVVSSSYTHNVGMGGLIGYIDEMATIDDCYSTCTISGGNHGTGGLIGYGKITVNNCYATGAVSGNIRNGGFLGQMLSGSSMNNCYSVGAVSGGADTGGLIGHNSDSNPATNCFWDTETSGQGGSAGGTGKTTAQMKQEVTFTNWDFADIWNITEDVTYPWLIGEKEEEGESEYFSNGYIRINHDSGADYTDWTYYGLLTTQPDNTNVKLRCRSAPTESGLSSASWDSYVETTSGSLGCLNNRWIEVEIYSETSDTSVTPAVHKLILEYKK